jgi:hypothetical protein
MNHLSNLNLTLDSNLGNLLLWEIEIKHSYTGKQLFRLFDQEPLIPGVIVTQDHHYQGMISRQIFFEFMSRPFSLVLFSERDIESLYSTLKPEVFVMMEEVLIVDAVPIVLARGLEQIYEPIVIKTLTDNYRVLDIHQLLLAYSQIQMSAMIQFKAAREKFKITQNNLQRLQKVYLETIQAETVQTMTQIRDNSTQDINYSANILVGNIIHIHRHVHNLLKLISLYQEFYPEPPAEIRQATKKINFEFISAEVPKLLTLVKNNARQVQRFMRDLRNSILG